MRGPCTARVCSPILLWTLVFSVGCSSIAYAQKRTALVVGNERYENISSVPKAEADAREVAKSLGALGFSPVVLELNAGHSAMNRAIELLAASVGLDDLVLFYFAGNGAAINAQNFLLPIDAPPARAREESRVMDDAIALSGVIARLQWRAAKVVSIVDASRDNPFDRPGIQPLALRTGLAPVSRLPPMTSILISASPNEKARFRVDSSDPNPNSIFGRVLLSQLVETDVSFAELAANVRTKVGELGQRHNFRQTPILYPGIADSVYLSGKAALKYPESLKVRTKSDGGKRFKLSEIENLEVELPDKDACAKLGLKFGDQLRREGGESVRFWVRIQRGFIGYCQLGGNRWTVEYFDRYFQDALILDFRK